MKIDSALLTEMANVIEGMKRNDSFNIFKAYFTKKSEALLEELIGRAGILTKEELLEANARLEVYRNLIEFEKTIQSELKYN